MLCVQQNPDGSLSVVSPQPADVSACGLVVQSGVEVGNNPFALSIEDAQLVGGHVFAVWAVAFGFRAVRKFLDDWSMSNE